MINIFATCAIKHTWEWLIHDRWKKITSFVLLHWLNGWYALVLLSLLFVLITSVASLPIYETATAFIRVPPYTRVWSWNIKQKLHVMLSTQNNIQCQIFFFSLMDSQLTNLPFELRWLWECATHIINKIVYF